MKVRSSRGEGRFLVGSPGLSNVVVDTRGAGRGRSGLGLVWLSCTADHNCALHLDHQSPLTMCNYRKTR